MTPRNPALTTLTARRKCELVIGLYASIALTLWAIREYIG